MPGPHGSGKYLPSSNSEHCNKYTECNVISTQMEIHRGLPVTHMGKQCPSLRQKYRIGTTPKT